MKKFIYGLITGFILIPILDELTNLIISLFELPKAAITKKILKENKVIADLQSEQEPISTQCIGFDLSQQEEYYDEDDEYFEDTKKTKFGFHA